MGKAQKKRVPAAPPRAADAAVVRSNVPVYVVLTGAVLAVFHAVIGYGFVDLDDLTYVVHNAAVTAGLTFHGIVWAFTHSYEGYWAPLTWLSYMADVQVFGLSGAACHATNVVLHAASACLLFAALKRITGAHYRCALVAALFAVHPLHVESVAWITERKDTLSTLFYFLTIWGYAGYAERRTPARYAFVIVAFACALMSKPMVVTLPVVLILLDVWPLGRFARLGAARVIREKVPLFAMALAVSAVAIVTQRGAGAMASLAVAPPATRIANGVVSCAVYLVKMVWPSDLAALYPYPRTVPALYVVAAGLLLLGVSVGVAVVRRQAPYAAVGWLWYLVTLLPVLGFLQAGMQARADRYTYVAMTGITIAAIWGLGESARSASRRILLGTFAGAALVTFGAVAWQQTQYWRDTESLFRRGLAVTSDNWLAHKALGNALLSRKQIDEAIVELRAAVALAPTYAVARSDLGNALLAANRPDEAVTELKQAIRLLPAYAPSHVNLGSALDSVGRPEAAEAEYREAVRLAPDDAGAHSGLGMVRAKQGDLDGARQELTAAIRLDPLYADAHLNLGTVLARGGHHEEAVREFREFTRLNVDAADGHIALGTLLAQDGRMKEAADELAFAVRLKPDDAMLRANFGIVLVSLGRIDEGTAQLSEAVRLRPDIPQLRENLDLALGMRSPSSSSGGRSEQPARQPR